MASDDGNTYRLRCNGECASGFDRENVISAFANLFSVTVKDVEKLFSGEMQFEKRNLNYFTAKQYHEAFSKIGVLSNFFLQDEKEKDLDVESENSSGITTCPKCRTQQNQSEVCEQCGIYFHKYKEIELRRSKKGSLSEDLNETIDDEISDHRKKEKIKDIRRAKLGIRYGSIFILGVFILDEILQMRNADIGYRPYILSTVFFIYGCWYYASIKGYSSYLGGLLGLANIAGLIILFLLPDRTASTRKKGFVKSVTAVWIAILVGIFWWLSYQYNQAFEKVYYEWTINCFAWDLVSGKCLDTDYVTFGLNSQLWKIKKYFFDVESHDTFDNQDVPKMNTSTISSMEIKNRSIAELRIASESMGKISDKLLVMAYYKQPTYSGRDIILKTKFVCIGGDVSNKYLMGDMSVFLYW